MMGICGESGDEGRKGTNFSGSSSGIAIHGNMFNNLFYMNCIL